MRACGAAGAKPSAGFSIRNPEGWRPKGLGKTLDKNAPAQLSQHARTHPVQERRRHRECCIRSDAPGPLRLLAPWTNEIKLLCQQALRGLERLMCQGGHTNYSETKRMSEAARDLWPSFAAAGIRIDLL